MSLQRRLTLRCRLHKWIAQPTEGKHDCVDLALHVENELGETQGAFKLMCATVEDAIQTIEGSGAAELAGIDRIESGARELVQSGGQGFIAHVTRDKVWFEGLYGQGEGGEVSFEQYKLAVETYLRFLADPEHKPIEVEFPEQ